MIKTYFVAFGPYKISFDSHSTNQEFIRPYLEDTNNWSALIPPHICVDVVYPINEEPEVRKNLVDYCANWTELDKIVIFIQRLTKGQLNLIMTLFFITIILSYSFIHIECYIIIIIIDKRIERSWPVKEEKEIWWRMTWSSSNKNHRHHPFVHRVMIKCLCLLNINYGLKNEWMS